jgi:ketopantoate reductase
MEIEALYGVPLEIGTAAGVRAPMLELLISLVKVRARRAGLY